MNSRYFYLSTLFLACLLSCQSNRNQTNIKEDEATIRSVASNSNQAGKNCANIQGVSWTKDVDGNTASNYTGEDIYNLSAKCVFNQDVHEVKIRILGETFEKVLADGCSNRDSGYGHVLELSFDGQKIEDVGIKTRGNTSNCNAKRQFKFKFNAKEMFSVWQGKKTIKTFNHKSRRFFGLEGFSVRSSNNDPSNIRESLSSKIFTQASDLAPASERGALVYRVAFAKMFVSYNRAENEGPEANFKYLKNGFYYDYKGFYSLSENIDETFLQSRFQRDDKKLKKISLFQADLARAYFTRNQYRADGWSPNLIDGEKPDDVLTPAQSKQAKDILFSLFDKLNDNSTEEELAQVIDIDSVINYVTGAILTGHWDSMLANRNNDFLYYDGTNNKWKIITWDLDNTLGALHDQYSNLMAEDIFNPAKKNKSRLFEVIFNNNHHEFRKKLSARLGKALNSFYSDSQLDKTIDNLSASVVRNIDSSWEGVNAQSFNDIKNFAKSRRTNIKSQLK